MRKSTLLLIGAVTFTAVRSRGADPAGPHPTVQAVSGHLLDEETGQWTTEDVFGPNYVPFNKLDIPLIVVVTVDLGEACVMPKPSSQEAWAIARGERPPLKRPAACEKPPWRVAISIKYGDGVRERQGVALSRFSSGSDGKIRVPFLFYRRLPCAPLELAVQTSTSGKSLIKEVDFVCRE